MTKIESNTGLLYLNEFCFPPESKFEEENVHTINNDSYSNLTKEGIFNELNFKATAYYKNSKLKSINLYFETLLSDINNRNVIFSLFFKALRGFNLVQLVSDYFLENSMY